MCVVGEKEGRKKKKITRINIKHREEVETDAQKLQEIIKMSLERRGIISIITILRQKKVSHQHLRGK